MLWILMDLLTRLTSFGRFNCSATINKLSGDNFGHSSLQMHWMLELTRNLFHFKYGSSGHAIYSYTFKKEEEDLCVRDNNQHALIMVICLLTFIWVVSWMPLVIPTTTHLHPLSTATDTIKQYRLVSSSGNYWMIKIIPTQFDSKAQLTGTHKDQTAGGVMFLLFGSKLSTYKGRNVSFKRNSSIHKYYTCQ